MSKNSKNLKTDFVIVGAGTIGLFLFDQLKKLNKKVILIEKGSLTASIKKTNDILSKEKYHKGTFSKRAFGVGGNSTIWGGQLVEFFDKDLDKYSYDLGLRKNELKSLYNQLYKIFKIRKVSSDQYLKKNKINLKDKNKKIKYFFSNWLTEPNFAKYYNKIIKNYSEDIFLNTNIKNLNSDKKKIKSLEIFYKNQKILINANKFIITMGTVETIKFFLKNKKIIKSNNYIGKYFQDHLGIHVGHVRIINKKNFSTFFENGVMNDSKYQPKLFYQEIKKNYSLSASGEFKFFSKHDLELSQFKKYIRDFMRYKKIKDLFKICKMSLKLNIKILIILYNFIFFKKIKSFYDEGVKFYIQSEQIPLKDSFIKFDKSKKKFIQSWKIDGRELEFIKNFAVKVNQLLKNKDIAEINLSKFINYDQSKFKNILRDTNHPAGGLILSFKNKNSLINKNFSIRGKNNLFVIGNCLYKKSSFSNITFTTLALALKFINRIKTNV